MEGSVGSLHVIIQLSPGCRAGTAAPDDNQGGCDQEATSNSMQGRVHNDDSGGETWLGRERERVGWGERLCFQSVARPGPWKSTSDTIMRGSRQSTS